ncbi:MAG TPA: hypothetical protein VHL09_13770 [Dehalococcoidia bacterium]|nr:hypothetical protein [Dehalococcoidia bacterium]
MSVNGYGPSKPPAIRLGEVIEASTTELVAESYELHESPAFGSLVRVGDPGAETYGLVYASSTASLDPGRRPVARGRDLEREDEIYQNHPQIVRLLRTEFRALIVGYRDRDVIRQRIAPFPVRIHSFVWACTPAEVIQFTQRFDYLTLLIGAQTAVPADELVAAAVRSADQARGGDDAYRIAAGKSLAVLLNGQFQRLNTILRQVRP